MDSTLSRRSLLLGGLAAGAAPTNVLFIMADQFRHDALSCAGNPVVETPNLDRLAADGVRFTDAVCTTPLCGPSRASLLTGQYAHGHQCWGNFEISQPRGLPESAQTWDETLAANRYRVEYHGKWHTGAANRSCYHDGLPYYLERYHKYLEEQYPGRGKAEGEAIDRYTKWPYRPFPVDRMMAEAIRRKLSMPHHNEAGENTVPASKSLTAWTAGGVVRFLESKPRRPFSITCSILHPHAPLVASPPYTTLYNPAKMPMPRVLDDVYTPPGQRSIPKVLTLTPEGLGSYISLYYGLVREVDDWVGRILAALDGAGLASNTLVIFTADHGEMLGEHSRVSKMVFYEASLRVPLLMRLPGRIPKKRKLRAPASGADVAPTILDYCNIPVPRDMHGRSLRGAIENGKAGITGALCELSRPEASGAQRMWRTPEWKLSFVGGRPYLYHLAEDPDETRNLLDPKHRRERWVAEAGKLRAAMLARLEETHSSEVDRIRALVL
jgi:arylsulfatase A-like enzyme